jgi:putative transposase
MIVNKTFRYELEPNIEQSKKLKQHAGNLRFVWNKLVALYYLYRENKYTCTKSDFQKLIHDLLDEFEFLCLSHSQALQFPAHNLVKAIRRAFDEDTVKERNKAIAKAKEEPNEELRKKKLEKAYNLGFPKFKKKSRSNDSIYIPQGFKIAKSRIYIPKIGWIHYHKHRYYEGKVKTITIVQEGDKWYVCFCCEVNIKRTELNKNDLGGFDLGLTRFLTEQNGDYIENPRPLKKKLNKLRTENKSLSRKYEDHKKNGGELSNNYKKQSNIVRNTHRKVKNARLDFLIQTAHNIITKYSGGVVVEDLYVKGMLKNKKLAKHISDVSWSNFLRILEYMCLWNSKYFVQIGRWEATSKTCSCCGWVNHDLTLNDRIFICPHCGLRMNRDKNAAINIHRIGLELIEEYETFLPIMINYLNSSINKKAKEYKKVEDFVQLGNLGIIKYKDFTKVKSIIYSSVSLELKKKTTFLVPLEPKTTAGTAGCNACGDVPVGTSVKQEKSF